jgi:alpha-tubulin suppressor-like RCC1 family protein
MGLNNFGQLGLGDKKSKNTPTNVESLVEHFITKVACGGDHTLAITDIGVCFAWGRGREG